MRSDVDLSCGSQIPFEHEIERDDQEKKTGGEDEFPGLPARAGASSCLLGFAADAKTGEVGLVGFRRSHEQLKN